MKLSVAKHKNKLCLFLCSIPLMKELRSSTYEALSRRDKSDLKVCPQYATLLQEVGMQCRAAMLLSEIVSAQERTERNAPNSVGKDASCGHTFNLRPHDALRPRPNCSTTSFNGFCTGAPESKVLPFDLHFHHIDAISASTLNFLGEKMRVA